MSPRLHVQPTLSRLAAVLAAALGAALLPGSTADAQAPAADHPPIAYRACPQDQCGLFVRDPSGGERRLTSNGEDRPQSWSPDGREIAYVSQTYPVEAPEGEPGLFVIGADGSGQREVSGDVATRAAWSPDGQWIGFLRGQGGTGPPTELAVVPPDGTQGHVVTTDIASFAWAPDGQRFAALTTSAQGEPAELQIVTVQGDIEHTVPLTGTGISGEPAWSPDATRIAYGVHDPEAGRFGGSRAYMVSADGTDRREIGATHDQPHARSWGPDGARIAMARTYQWSTSVIASDVDVVDAQDGSVITHITMADRELHEPVWSADGLRLYMATRPSHRSGTETDFNAERWLTVTDAQGRNPTDLIVGGGHYVVGPAVSVCPQQEWYEVERAPLTDRDAIPAAHRTNVDCAVHHAIVRGFPDGSYRPSLDVRRDQMATFVAGALEAAGVPLAPPDDHRFDDVAVDSPHAEAINQLAEAGVVQGGPQGLPEDSYGPGLTVRRDQMASFLVRAAEAVTGGDLRSQNQRFDDVPPANAHFATVNGAAENGLAQGFGDGTFRPGTGVSRAQTASFAVRLLSLLTDEVAE